MENQTKVRVDHLLHSKGLFPSREAARRAIMAGLVSRSNGERIDKPGTMVRNDEEFTIQGTEHRYVSRGGIKLERALSSFAVSLEGRIVIDVGASTGGFTDCALQNGAAMVYAVDVGYGQLAWKLRNDARVKVMERVNFRHATADIFHPRPEIAVMDVSFISTRLLLPNLRDILLPPGDVLSLVKPQFEAGREHVGKGGIVRDPAVHVDVLAGLISFVNDLGWFCGGIDYSPISGGDGNIEFLSWWTPRSENAHPSLNGEQCRSLVSEVVSRAWAELNGEDVSSKLHG